MMVEGRHSTDVEHSRMALFGGVLLDTDPNLRVVDASNVWGDVVDKLKQTDEGTSIANDAEFQKFYQANIEEINLIYGYATDPVFRKTIIEPDLARTFYYAHPSFMDMRDRPEVLEMIVDGTVSHIETLLQEGKIKSALLRRRRLASLYEELGSITEDSRAQEYDSLAIEQNRIIVESELYLLRSPRKLHAVFSPYDILMRNEGSSLSSDRFNEIQAAYYREMASTVLITRIDNPDKQAVSGTFGELLVLGRLRDLIEEMGLTSKIDASQCFLRQDDTNNLGLGTETKWKWSFDIFLKNRNTKEQIFIEVKTRIAKSRTESGADSYLPIINVILLRSGYNVADYLKNVENYARGRQNSLEGNRMTGEQRAVVSSLNAKIDRPLRWLLESLAA